MLDKDFIRILTTPACVIVGVLAVLYVFTKTMTMMPDTASMDAMKEATGVAGSAIAMIGTLVGFVAGQAVGAAGKEKADQRASDAMEKAMTAERRVAAISSMSSTDVVAQAKDKYPELFK